jgi:hypothetical protein
LYENWLQFQLQRSRPRVYDDDEIADDIIDAIKSSKYASKLKEGLESVPVIKGSVPFKTTLKSTTMNTIKMIKIINIF